MRPVLAISLVAIALSWRLALSTLGHNYDYDSYELVTKLMITGRDIYTDTHRYNYSPLWAHILAACYWISTWIPLITMRHLVVIILSSVDVTLSYILYRRYGIIAAALILLHPLSTMISGYHNQFDQFAVCVGAIGVLIYERYLSQPRISHTSQSPWIAATLIGLSLIVKHVLFVYPLWLAMREYGRSRRDALILLVVPIWLYALTFVPHIMGGSWQGIQSHVLSYSPPYTSGLLALVVPQEYDSLTKGVFVLSMVAMGYLVRYRDLWQHYCLYLLAVVALASGSSTQQAVIPLTALASQITPISLIYLWESSHLIQQSHLGVGGWGRAMTTSIAYQVLPLAQIIWIMVGLPRITGRYRMITGVVLIATLVSVVPAQISLYLRSHPALAYGRYAYARPDVEIEERASGPITVEHPLRGLIRSSDRGLGMLKIHLIYTNDRYTRARDKTDDLYTRTHLMTMRVRESGSDSWLSISTASAHLAYGLPVFPYGFVPISYSEGKVYEYELTTTGSTPQEYLSPGSRDLSEAVYFVAPRTRWERLQLMIAKGLEVLSPLSPHLDPSYDLTEQLSYKRYHLRDH